MIKLLVQYCRDSVEKCRQCPKLEGSFELVCCFETVGSIAESDVMAMMGFACTYSLRVFTFLCVYRSDGLECFLSSGRPLVTDPVLYNYFAIAFL